MENPIAAASLRYTSICRIWKRLPVSVQHERIQFYFDRAIYLYEESFNLFNNYKSNNYAKGKSVLINQSLLESVYYFYLFLSLYDGEWQNFNDYLRKISLLLYDLNKQKLAENLIVPVVSKDKWRDLYLNERNTYQREKEYATCDICGQSIEKRLFNKHKGSRRCLEKKQRTERKKLRVRIKEQEERERLIKKQFRESKRINAATH